MDPNLQSVLTERRRQISRSSKWWSAGVSVVLHAALVTAPILAPLVAAKPAEPIEFVSVQIVPLQALGIREPEPRPASPRPEPEVPKTPTLPDPDKTPQRQPPPPERQTRQPAPPQPSPLPSTEPRRREGSPLGDTLGVSSLGASVGGLDNPDFVYSYYVDQMLSLISANWVRPALGGQIEAAVHFRIHRDGHISDLRVLRSSGYNSFDLAGLRAVQAAAPFPRLPQTYSHDSLGVTLILR